MQHETRGNCNAIGASGEKGCWQYLTSTWNLFSRDVYGEVRHMTKVRERYVTTKKIEAWVKAGYDAGEIAQLWNTGRAGPCIKGTNSKGVEYDSCKYESSVLAILNRSN